MKTPKRSSGLLNLTLAVVLVIALGYVLIIGQGFIVPIIIALISVYILAAMDAQLGRWALTRWMPAIVRRLFLTAVFTGLLSGMASLVIVTVQQLIERAPSYQRNLESIAGQIAGMLRLSSVPDWATIEQYTIGQLNLQSIITSVASQLSAFGGSFFLIVIYVVFLLGERARFSSKLALAFPDANTAEQMLHIVDKVNTRIGQYLAAKTLINTILGVISYIVMVAFGIDYAPFWALLTALLNYIPYLGSIIALIFPVALSVVQYASLPMTTGVWVGLQLAQIAVGNFLEPKMLSQRVNLSAFVVILSLALWSSIWGIAGAILAVPLTSMLVIVFAEIPAMRPLAVMMSENTASFEEGASA